MQTPLTFFFAFIVVLALIGLAAWLVRRFAGNRLGAIRDAKGKSVAAVFSELGGNQKAEVCHIPKTGVVRATKYIIQILRALAMKVLGSAASTL